MACFILSIQDGAGSAGDKRNGSPRIAPHVVGIAGGSAGESWEGAGAGVLIDISKPGMVTLGEVQRCFAVFDQVRLHGSKGRESPTGTVGALVAHGGHVACSSHVP